LALGDSEYHQKYKADVRHRIVRVHADPADVFDRGHTIPLLPLVERQLEQCGIRTDAVDFNANETNRFAWKCSPTLAREVVHKWILRIASMSLGG
jgi:hypothetical protein